MCLVWRDSFACSRRQGIHMDAGIWCVIQLYIGLHTSIGGSGQLGLGATKRVEDASISWVEVSFLSQHRVISLSCGSRHSVAVTLTGDVYTWGRGCEGQTGHRFTDDNHCNKSDPHVTKFACWIVCNHRSRVGSTR
mgnify:FL=1